MIWSTATPEQVAALAAEVLTGEHAAHVQLESRGDVLGWAQGDEFGYLAPDGSPLDRVEVGLRENGVGPPAEPEPGVFYDGEEYEPDPADPLQHSRTMVVQFLPTPAAELTPAQLKRLPVAAELNADGELYCTACGSGERLEFRENVLSCRHLKSNVDGELVFYSTAEEGDGDDDPGVCCDACDRPLTLPEGVTVAWS